MVYYNESFEIGFRFIPGINTKTKFITHEKKFFIVNYSSSLLYVQCFRNKTELAKKWKFIVEKRESRRKRWVILY